jgi:hypothetical protein
MGENEDGGMKVARSSVAEQELCQDGKPSSSGLLILYPPMLLESTFILLVS